ncbi:hypothetical protein RUND412_004322 [Rhizina undulata]
MPVVLDPSPPLVINTSNPPEPAPLQIVWLTGSNGQPYGLETALLASFILGASSIPRAIKTGKPLPIGLSVLAAYGLFYYGLKLKSGN